MTTADLSAPPASPPSQHPAVREFTRLAAHVRLVAAGILLLFRTAVIAILFLTWPAVTEPSWVGAIQPDQLIGVMITAAVTIWCIQFLMPWESRPIRTALFTTIAIILWTSIAALLFWNEPMADRRAHILRLAAVILGGSGVAAIASRYARLLLQSPGEQAPIPAGAGPAPTASFARFCRSCAAQLGDADTCPACGRYSPKPDLRPALENETARMRSAWQRGLFALRCLALLIGTLVLAGVAQSWAGPFLYYGANPDRLFYLVLWCFLGSVTGSGTGFLAIHRPRSLAVATAVGVTLVGLATGIIFFTLAAAPMPYRNLPSLFWQAAALASATAACGALVTHWLLTFIVTRFAPRASAQLMLGRKIDRPAPANAPAPPSPRTCESCGYQLEGLPATRCEKCFIVSLRCPECGHTQPANTLNARLLGLVYKLHALIRAASWLIGLGIIAFMLMPWMAIAAFSGSDLTRNIGWDEVLFVLTLSFVIVSPIRLLLLHGRRLWLISMFVALLPSLLMVAGAGTGSHHSFSEAMWVVTILFVPCWLIVSFSTPYLWRSWLWIIFGRDLGAELFQWHRSDAYRHSSPEQILTDPDRAAGRELQLHCSACGTSIPPAPAVACPACGTCSLPCPACKEPLPLSAVRIGFESILHRLRLAGLALLAVFAAAAIVVLIAADLINGSSMFWFCWSEHSDRGYITNTIESGILCAILFGILGRMMLIRRPTIIAAAIVAVMHVLWFVAFPMAFGSSQFRPNPITYAALLALTIGLGSGGLAFIAALLGRPLLRLAMQLLPRDLRHPLYMWLTAQQSLDQSAAQLS